MFYWDIVSVHIDEVGVVLLIPACAAKELACGFSVVVHADSERFPLNPSCLVRMTSTYIVSSVAT